jgi:hypothetical protein
MFGLQLGGVAVVARYGAGGGAGYFGDGECEQNSMRLF